MIVTILIGIVGGIVGGWLSTQLGFGPMEKFSIGGIIMAVIGAAILLVGWRILKKKMD